MFRVGKAFHRPILFFLLLFFFYHFSPRFFTFVFYFIIRPADDPSLSVSLEQCNDNTAKHVEISLSIFLIPRHPG